MPPPTIEEANEPIHVNVDNFVQAETARMFADIQRDAGGITAFRHNRAPASIDEQTVIRLNRDTLYSFAIVDLAEPAELTLPDAQGRYISAMIVNEQHLINAIHHDPGTYTLSRDRFESRYVLVAVRILVDPLDPEDVAAVVALQDQLGIVARSAVPFAYPDYDPTSLDATRDALLSLAGGLTGFDHTFGSRDEIDPIRHLLGTAAGWGGLPSSEAAYVGVQPDIDGAGELTMADVPVDAFWSVSVYNAKGFFEPNPQNRYTVNSVTGARNDDGSITVRFTPDPTDSHPNAIFTPAGWNYLVRFYRPRPAYFDGSWTLPDMVAAS